MSGGELVTIPNGQTQMLVAYSATSIKQATELGQCHWIDTFRKDRVFRTVVENPCTVFEIPENGLYNPPFKVFPAILGEQCLS